MRRRISRTRATAAPTTDRAKVLILMGRPEGVQNKGPDQAVQGLGSGAGGTDQVRGNSQIWFYNPAELPEGFKVKGSQLYFLFYEDTIGSNAFNLDRSARESFMGLAALTDAPEVYLLHPDMNEIPKPVSIAGGRKAPAEHLAWLGQDAPFNETARVLAELGVNDGVTRPLWVYIELPPDAPTVEFLTGQVRSAEGEVLSNFEIDAVPLNGQYGKAYDLSFPLEPGAYTVEVVGGAAAAPLVTEKIEIEVAEVTEDGTWMSPLWLGLSAAPNEKAKLGEPYNFGGWHLVPVTGPDFTRENEIVFFGFVVRPAVNDEGRRRASGEDPRQEGRPVDGPAPDHAGGCLAGVRRPLHVWEFDRACRGCRRPGATSSISKSPKRPPTLRPRSRCRRRQRLTTIVREWITRRRFLPAAGPFLSGLSPGRRPGDSGPLRWAHRVWAAQPAAARTSRRQKG